MRGVGEQETWEHREKPSGRQHAEAGWGVAVVCSWLAFGGVSLEAAPDVPRTCFTPHVVPQDFTQAVRFEATVTEKPPSVAFEYDGVDRSMYDDGTHGDQVAGDGTWTILFQPSEILRKLTPAWVYRPFLGYCKPAGGGRFNIFAEIWTPDMGLVNVKPLGADAQATDYLVNFIATRSQLQNFDAFHWARRFYGLYPDDFDFLSFLHIAGKRGNRYHQSIKNDVLGIGMSVFDQSAQYGSAGRLKGYTVFPLSTFFDCGGTAFSHETGHQWINFLSDTAFASGIPHWPRGNVAINIMGFSIPGSGAGGTYSYTFTPHDQGGFVVGPGNAANQCVFNGMELYLMGMVPPGEVEPFFVLKDQNQQLTVGQILPPAAITPVTIDNIVAVHGPRLPDSANAQKTFRSATVVLSEELLDPYAISFYDWFARRAEATQPLTFASGLQTGTCNPFFLATGGRATMLSRIAVSPSSGGLRVPGDANGDKVLDISDAVALLGYLFLGSPKALPCGDGSESAPGNLTLLDWQPDGKIDISDAVEALHFLFLGGNPHPLAVPGAETKSCVPMVGCADGCGS